MADTRELVADINAAVRDRLVAAGRVDDTLAVVTDGGERIGRGDRVATRRNDRQLGVANRETWTVQKVDRLGRVVVTDQHRVRVVDPDYAKQYIELANATTVYGAQGQTVSVAHVAVGEHTGAAAAYVAMTRGRHNNTAHLVADDLNDARRQWIDVFGRDRADLGPAHAARLAAEQALGYVHASKPNVANDVSRANQPHRRTPSPSRGPGIGR